MSFFVVVAVAGLLSGPVESAYFGGGKQLVVDCAAKSPPSLKVALRSAYQKVEKSSEQVCLSYVDVKLILSLKLLKKLALEIT